MGRNGARVLIVDDDPSIRDVVGDFLELLGCTIDTAANGQEALEQVAAVPPDLVLLDYMMPIMDGKAFGLQVRTQPRHAGLPIVLMSASPDSDAVCEAIGARACLRKPFDIDELAEIVHRVTGQ
jgi:CheY-like chemotaxis protein